jgi:molybdenum cofactor cytidylyltransferase
MICAIVPAAGCSARMGVPKQLLPFGATSAIGHVVGQLRGSTLDDVYVVLGHEAEKVAAALAGHAIQLVPNPDYQAGMLSSVRCGLRAIPPQCGAILVALGDQPAITTSLVDRLLDLFRTSGRRIVVPVHGGRRGHPLVFSTAYAGEILERYDEVGLRGLLQAHPEEVLEFEAATAAVLCDMDSPGDYRRELTRFEQAGGAGPGLASAGK